MDFANIVYYREQPLLYIHHVRRAIGKFVHMFVYTDVREHRLDNRQTLGIYRLPASLYIFAFISSIRVAR